jgi:hypothetical protein
VLAQPLAGLLMLIVTPIALVLRQQHATVPVTMLIGK